MRHSCLHNAIANGLRIPITCGYPLVAPISLINSKGLLCLGNQKTAAARQGDEKMDETGKINVDIKQVNDQIEKAKEKINQVNEKIEKVDVEIKQVNEEIKQVNQEIKQVNEKIEKVNEEIKQVNVEIKQVNEKIERVILGTAEYANVEKEDREKILVGLKSQLDGSIKSELSRLKAFLDDLRSQLSRLDADKDFFRSQLSKLDAEKEQWIKMLQQERTYVFFIR
jgi:chromosome segregation ATPase